MTSAQTPIEMRDKLSPGMDKILSLDKPKRSTKRHVSADRTVAAMAPKRKGHAEPQSEKHVVRNLMRTCAVFELGTFLHEGGAAKQTIQTVAFATLTRPESAKLN